MTVTYLADQAGARWIASEVRVRMTYKGDDLDLRTPSGGTRGAFQAPPGAPTPSASNSWLSRALAEAAACARLSGDDEKAMELAGRIPLEAIAKTAQMEVLLGQRNWDAIIERFGDEEQERHCHQSASHDYPQSQTYNCPELHITGDF